MEEGAPERGVNRLSVKQAGLALPEPNLKATENWTLSCFITRHLVAALSGHVEFRTADHSAFLQEVWAAVWRRSTQRAEESLAATIAGARVQGVCQLQRATNTRAWLTVQLSTANGTELGDQEWRDVLFLRYGLDPPDLPKYCDSCNAKFTTRHNLREAALSLHVIMRSGTGLQTWPAKTSLPRTCTTTPSYSQVAPRRGQRLSQTGLVVQQTETARRRQRPQNRRETP